MSDFNPEFWIQLIVYAASFGTYVGTNNTRLKHLEKKMDKHNNAMDRLARCESSAQSAHKRLDDMTKGGH